MKQIILEVPDNTVAVTTALVVSTETTPNNWNTRIASHTTDTVRSVKITYDDDLIVTDSDAKGNITYKGYYSNAETNISEDGER